MKKKIVIAGGTGLLGSRLTELLNKDVYDIHVLTRSDRKDTEHIKYIHWDTGRRELEKSKLEGTDIILNLAGAGIADKRWTRKRKNIILQSRIAAAETLEKAIGQMAERPSVFLSASAVGYYGDRGEEILKESSAPGKGFLPEVCLAWEEANNSAGTLCDRHASFRIGIVLSSRGGALAEILKTTWTGVYGYFGDGSAYYSWIHIDDLCRMIIRAMENESYQGVYNGTAENPVRIRELLAAVKKAQGKFGILVPVPAVFLKLVLGEMANMLLNSQRVIPSRALSEGFSFRYQKPEFAIANIIDKEI